MWSTGIWPGPLLATERSLTMVMQTDFERGNRQQVTLSGPEQVQHTGHAVESTAEFADIAGCAVVALYPRLVGFRTTPASGHARSKSTKRAEQANLDRSSDWSEAGRRAGDDGPASAISVRFA